MKLSTSMMEYADEPFPFQFAGAPLPHKYVKYTNKSRRKAVSYPEYEPISTYLHLPHMYAGRHSCNRSRSNGRTLAGRLFPPGPAKEPGSGAGPHLNACEAAAAEGRTGQLLS